MSSVGQPVASVDTVVQPSSPVGQTVGIDFGASCSAVARLDPDGVPRLLPDGAGRDLIESILTFDHDGVVRVGTHEDVPAGASVVTAVKRYLGDRGFALRHGGQTLSPELLSALILRKLAQDAGRFGDLAGVILTVPSYFFAPGRRATLSAGRIAALPVVELLAEPIAAALAHLWRTDSLLDDRNLLVFDLGGGTLDVTIVRATGGRLLVAATEGDNALGGIDWTTQLVDFTAEKFRRRHGRDLRSDGPSLRKLKAACEAAKRALVDEPRVVIDVQHDGLTMPLGVSRDEFEQITADLLRRARDTAEFLFESSGIEPDDLDDVLLVGGGTLLPCVRRMMTELCGRPITTPPDPQRAVAEGAAIYAAAVAVRQGEVPLSPELMQRLESISLRDVNAHSLGIALDDPNGKAFSRNHILLPRNTALPATVKRRFVTSLANPEGIALRLVEGEAPEVASCTIIGDWRISELPASLPAGSPVQVTIRCDRQRSVTVEAKDLTTQTPARVEKIGPDESATERARHVLAGFRLV